jgi:hypothetical protein
LSEAVTAIAASENAASENEAGLKEATSVNPGTGKRVTAEADTVANLIVVVATAEPAHIAVRRRAVSQVEARRAISDRMNGFVRTCVNA